ncbi:MAG TPA: chemotaxis-specific protein-glutamate methyltransferase CheB [Geobacteraceae bacterium]|nr:chemotaxis-specific protein-glutamate methyltransferase CheB [Geobacteraceae bacterium]
MIRLLLVEDSKTVQQALVEIFNTDPDIRVIGIAADGEEAVNAAMTMKPDVITMDINMPGMDGFEATRAIMFACPTPIIIVTGKMDPKDSATLFRVMEAGALMITAKPFPPGHPEHGESVRELIKTVKLMSEIKVVRRSFPRETRGTLPVTSFQQIVPTETAAGIRIVAIGASTGGPQLLQSILSSLPSDFRAPVAIVQHMAKGFTGDFVNWLNQSSRLPVELAVDGRHMSPGRVYVAPDGFQMQVAPGDRIILSEDPPENGQRPSVSSLFRSVARVYGRSAAGVLLTGMGKDGAEELKTLLEKGGITVAQNRESSVVFGMPGEAVRINAAEHILPPEEIIALLIRLVNGPRSAHSPTTETGKPQ